MRPLILLTISSLLWGSPARAAERLGGPRGVRPRPCPGRFSRRGPVRGHEIRQLRRSSDLTSAQISKVLRPAQASWLLPSSVISKQTGAESVRRLDAFLSLQIRAVRRRHLPPLDQRLTRRTRLAALGYSVVDADGTLWAGDVGDFFGWLRQRDDDYRLRTDWIARIVNRAGTVEDLRRTDSDAYYRAMTRGLAGMKVTRVQRLAAEYFDQHHRGTIFPEMRQMIRDLDHAGFPAWIVSGGPHEVVVAGARRVGGEALAKRVIGLRLKRDPERGILTFDFDGPIPWGRGKVEAIKHWIPEKRRPAIAIGNSSEGDGPMLAHATDLTVAIHPDEALRRVADITRLPSVRGRFSGSRANMRRRRAASMRSRRNWQE